MNKLKIELINFIEFYNKFNFQQIQLEKKEDKVFYKGKELIDETGKLLGETEEFINVGYKNKGSIQKALSNLFPYEFIFKGKKVSSIESVFQGIKFPSKKEQDLVLKYSGMDSNSIKAATNYDWKKTGIVYWQGKPIDRFSDDYQKFLIELYVSAIQNPLYRNTLKNVDKYILHSIGEEDSNNTVFSRYEFEKMLNALVLFLKG